MRRIRSCTASSSARPTQNDSTAQSTISLLSSVKLDSRVNWRASITSG
jgi:hypothetical protein